VVVVLFTFKTEYRRSELVEKERKKGGLIRASKYKIDKGFLRESKKAS